jgi:hypothetical protein
MAEPRGFDALPAALAPFTIRGKEGRFLAVNLDGQIVGMREEAVRERLAARQNLQIASHDEYDHAHAQREMGGVGGQAITAGASVANGALLGLGIPFTAAALGHFSPELGHKFTSMIEQGREAHPGTALVGELGGGFTKLPGALVEEAVGVGRSALSTVMGADVANAMAETARYKAAAQQAQEAIGGAARAGEAEALAGGIPAQRARAFVQGEAAGVPKALREARAAAPEALPTAIKPSYTQEELQTHRQSVLDALARKPPPSEKAALEKALQQIDEQIPTGAKLRTEPVGGRRREPFERIAAEPTVEGLQEQAQAARRVMAEAPEAVATQKMIPSVERMESRVEAMKRAAGDAKILESEGVEGVIANRERRLEAIRGLKGADPKMVSALEEELAALKQQHAPPLAAAAAAEDLGATRSVGAPEVFAEERMARRAATEEQLDPLREAVRRQSLPYEMREGALARQAAAESKWAPAVAAEEKGLEALRFRAEVSQGMQPPLEKLSPLEQLRHGAEMRGLGGVAELRGPYGGEPLAVPRARGGVLGEVRRATEAAAEIPREATRARFPQAAAAADAAEAAAREGILPPVPEGVGKLGGETVQAEPIDRMVQQRGGPAQFDKTLSGVAPSGAAPMVGGGDLGTTMPGVAPLSVEGRELAAPSVLESARGATEGQVAFGEALTPKAALREEELNQALADVYRKHPEAIPEQFPGAFGREHAVSALEKVKLESLMTDIERLQAAEADAAYQTAKARAESVKGIADAMGTVPAALQPEFLVRAFLDGAGSRMTYNVLNDKENTIPGIVGDGVMTAIAASAFHAGVSKVLSRFGSKAGAAIAKEEAEFQKAATSTDPAEMVGFIRRQLENAALRRVGLDTEAAVGSMNKYLKGRIDPVTGEVGYAGGPRFVAETLLHDLPRAVGKKSLGDFKNIDEIHTAINKAWGNANEGIDRLVMEMDKAVTSPGPLGGTKSGMSTISSMTNALFDLEAEAMAPRTIGAGGPPVAKAIRTQTVEFLRAQGALDEGAMKQMGMTLSALSNPEMVDNTKLRVFLRDGWEGDLISYAGLKNTANQMRFLSYAGDIDPALRGGKEVFAKFRGTIEKTLEDDMDRMFAGQGEKYDYAKRNWQAWNYINEATEKKLLQQQVARIGSAEAISILGRAGVTGYTAMFHPVTAAAATAGFIAPRAAGLNMVQNAWLGLLQKVSGGIHIDNKRLAMAAAKEKGIEDFLRLDLSKIPAGKTKVMPASDVYESLLATRALSQNPQAAMNAMSQVAQSAGAIAPELAANSVSRTQKAIAILSASLPRAMKSDQWGTPDEEHMRIDPFELKRWQNVFQGVTDPASVFDDLKMGDLPADKIRVLWDLYPEMMDSVSLAIAQKHGKKSKASVKGAKVPLNLGQMKQPKLHYEKAAAVKGLMGPHASNVSIGMDKDHFQGAQDSYKAMEPQQQGGGGGGGGAMAPPSRMAAYQAPFGQATGMATDAQITTRRA